MARASSDKRVGCIYCSKKFKTERGRSVHYNYVHCVDRIAKQQPAPPPLNATLLLEKLTEAVTTTYPNDPSDPGVVVSFLKRGGFYGSICRYQEKWGGKRYVVHTAREKTLEAVLKNLADQLLRRQNIFNQLRAAAGGTGYVEAYVESPLSEVGDE